MSEVDEITVAMWAFQKELFKLIQRQQAQLDALYKSHYGLVDALRSECGLESKPPLPVDSAALERVEAGAAELERMFRLDTEGKSDDA